MEKIYTLLVLLMFSMAVSAQQPDPVQLMEKSRDLTMSGNMKARVTLTITERNGSERNRTIDMYSRTYGDTEKRLIKFLDPADVRGTAMLIIDYKDAQDEMWIYLPALKRTRRIVTSEKGKSFMSSEFSNADMTSSTLSDFKIRHLPESGKNGQWVIESVPVDNDRADEYGYSRKVTYLSSDKLVTRKIEFYNFDNELFKTIEIVSTIPMQGKEGYIMTEMYAENHLNGRSSRVKFDEVNTSSTIPDQTFTVENLSR